MYSFTIYNSQFTILMNSFFTFALIVAFAIKWSNNYPNNYPNQYSNKGNQTTQILPKFQNADIIFQVSVSGQGKAIQLATKSIYTHCGIIFEDKNNKNELFVLEAIQPVCVTPLKEWIARGDKNHFVVKRLKNATQILTNETLSKMKIIGEKFINKNYDIHFGWSDERIYCSELVWKIYKNGANIEVGQLEKLKSFDLSSSEVKKIMKQRYGNKIPYEEDVISPASVFNSPLLTTVATDKDFE